MGGGNGRKVCSMILTSAWRFILIIFFSKIIYIFHFCLYFHFFFLIFGKKRGHYQTIDNISTPRAGRRGAFGPLALSGLVRKKR